MGNQTFWIDSGVEKERSRIIDQAKKHFERNGQFAETVSTRGPGSERWKERNRRFTKLKTNRILRARGRNRRIHDKCGVKHD